MVSGLPVVSGPPEAGIDTTIRKRDEVITYPGVRLPIARGVVRPPRCLTSPAVAAPTTPTPTPTTPTTPTPSACVWIRRPGRNGRNAPRWSLSTLRVRIRRPGRNVPCGGLSSLQVGIWRSRGSLPSRGLLVLNVRCRAPLPSGSLPIRRPRGCVRVDRRWPHVPARRLAIKVFQGPVSPSNDPNELRNKK